MPPRRAKSPLTPHNIIRRRHRLENPGQAADYLNAVQLPLAEWLDADGPPEFPRLIYETIKERRDVWQREKRMRKQDLDEALDTFAAAFGLSGQYPPLRPRQQTAREDVWRPPFPPLHPGLYPPIWVTPTPPPPKPRPKSPPPPDPWAGDTRRVCHSTTWK
jgi:hypothetical protein